MLEVPEFPPQGLVQEAEIRKTDLRDAFSRERQRGSGCGQMLILR